MPELSDIVLPQNLAVFHSLEDARHAMPELPAVRRLPPDTGKWNPVVMLVVSGKAAYLAYGPIEAYTRSRHRREFVHDFPDGRDYPFDSVTCSFWRKEDGVGSMPRDFALEQRRDFLRHAYLVGFNGESVVGGAWIQYMDGQFSKKGLRVARAHIAVESQYSGRGFGSEMENAFLLYLRQREKYNGVSVGWNTRDTLRHEANCTFFRRREWEVDEARGIAIKLLTAETAHAPLMSPAPATPQQGRVRTA